MKKTKFSLKKAKKAVEISSRIEGHKIKKSVSRKLKQAKSKTD